MSAGLVLLSFGTALLAAMWSKPGDDVFATSVGCVLVVVGAFVVEGRARR